MAEGIPISPPGGEGSQRPSSTPAEQPVQQSADKTQLLDTDALAAELEKAGFNNFAEDMRRPTPSNEEIRQRQHQENEARFAAMNATWKAKATGKSPSLDGEKAQRLNLHAVADVAEQQKKHTLAAELRNLANKPPTT